MTEPIPNTPSLTRADVEEVTQAPPEAYDPDDMLLLACRDLLAARKAIGYALACGIMTERVCMRLRSALPETIPMSSSARTETRQALLGMDM